MPRSTRAVRTGFTLLEIVLVMVIIGVLATVAALNLTNTADKARVNATKASLATIEQGLKSYYFEHGAYPTTQEGLRSLVTAKIIEEKSLVDAWKRPVQYYSPVQADPPYDLYSIGKDALDGTPDDIHVKEVK